MRVRVQFASLPLLAACFTLFATFSAHAQVRVATTQRLVNASTHKCLTLVRDDALSIVDEVARRGEVRACDRSSDPTGRQRFYLASTSGEYFTTGTPSGTFTIRPASHPGEKCLHHVWGSDFRFDKCDGSLNQQFSFVARGDGYWLKSRVTDLVPCMSNLLGSDAVSGELCSGIIGARSVWTLEQADGVHAIVDSYGAGGDVYFLSYLAAHGVALANINAYTLEQLRGVLAGATRSASVSLHRGQVLNNITRTPFSGVRVCSLSKPTALGAVIGVSGVPHACAFSDANGYYTLVGLPRATEITNTVEREGFLQLAYTMRTPALGDHQQEYVGTGTDALVALSYTDARYAYSASFQHGALGEMSFTVINETRAPSDPNYGQITPGTYTENGASGARFQVFTDPDGDGVFDAPYRDQVHTDPTLSQSSGDGIPDGLFYTGSLGEGLGHALNVDLEAEVDALVAVVPALEPFLVDSEFPQAFRSETQFHGLAVMRDLPPGMYEAEISHPTRTCYATRDAWQSGNPRRARFEVVKNTMGDARWYCLP